MTTMAATRRLSESSTQQGIVDCDTHPTWDSQSELLAFLEPKWHQVLQTYGPRRYAGGGYPRFWDDPDDKQPPSGLKAGADPEFMGSDHLDANDVAYAILIPPGGTGGIQNLDLATAMAKAVNDWQSAVWLDSDPRFRGSICLATEDPVVAAAEIRRVGSDPRYVQVQFSGRPAEPMGRRRYWPIYQACEELGLAVMSHAFGSSGHPITGTGWASYYIEDHIGPAIAMQANITSMIMEGVFERFPNLLVVSVENGFGWAPSLRWRLDSAWDRFASELPHLPHRPSEYFDEHVYLATQPIEEPAKREHFGQLLSHWPEFEDRLVFSSDYPHWDGDEPTRALPLIRDAVVRDKILRQNARRLYGLR